MEVRTDLLSVNGSFVFTWVMQLPGHILTNIVQPSTRGLHKEQKATMYKTIKYPSALFTFANDVQIIQFIAQITQY